MNFTPQETVINPRIDDKTWIMAKLRYLRMTVAKYKIKPDSNRTIARDSPVINIPLSYREMIIVVIAAGPAKIGDPMIEEIAVPDDFLIFSSSINEVPLTILIPNIVNMIPPAIRKYSISVLNKYNILSPNIRKKSEMTPATNTE